MSSKELPITSANSDILERPKTMTPQSVNKNESEPSDTVEDGTMNSFQHVKFTVEGRNLHILVISLCICLFLSTLESTIVGTALVAITNDLSRFDISSWIVTSYLLTYTGFLTVLAKLSDTFGRRIVMSLCIVLFIVFSIACGVAHSMIQLIVFRAFQGMGGGGMYTMTFVILPEMVSPTKYAKYSGIIAGVAALSSLLGPVFGGVISDKGTWKWIFLFNAPGGSIALILFYATLPAHFPYPEGTKSPANLSLGQKFRKVDIVGMILLLASSILLVTAIEEGGIRYPWDHAIVLILLILSLVLVVCTAAWSKYFEKRSGLQESLLPWPILSDHYAIGLLLVCFFTGLGFITCVIILPQHYQIVFGDSPSTAGYRLLAMTLATPLGSAAAGVALQKFRIPPLYVLLAGFAFVVVGIGLSTMNTHASGGFPTSEYGYQIIMGFGFGINLATVVMAAPLTFRPDDLAVGMGISNQFRVLGGSIGVAICANILNNQLTTFLEGLVDPRYVKALLASPQTVAAIPPDLRALVQEAFAASFVQQMQVVLGLSGAGFLTTLLMVERRPRFQQ